MGNHALVSLFTNAQGALLECIRAYCHCLEQPSITLISHTHTSYLCVESFSNGLTHQTRRVVIVTIGQYLSEIRQKKQ